MKVLVTGARGFIGKNLVVTLKRAGVDTGEFDIDSPATSLAGSVRGADAVFHLAGVNRPKDEAEFEAGNVGSVAALLEAFDALAREKAGCQRAVVVLASSTQAAQDNPYGRSKLAAEQLVEKYAERTGAPAVIYRLPGVFGKWCRPDYNSVVATYCHNIARGLPITISDPSHVLDLVHIDDVVSRFMSDLGSKPPGFVRGVVEPVFSISLGDLAARIRGFDAMHDSLEVPDASDMLTQRLLGTYLWYVPLSDLPYRLNQRNDPRGTLAELLKSRHFGQLFVSRTKPGITRGNHYHDLKVEKFCVLEGDAVIRFRPVLGAEVTEHRVSGTEFRVVDIPPGVTHSIENVGASEMIVLFWASETLDRDRPDTHASEVLGG